MLCNIHANSLPQPRGDSESTRASTQPPLYTKRPSDTSSLDDPAVATEMKAAVSRTWRVVAKARLGCG